MIYNFRPAKKGNELKEKSGRKKGGLGEKERNGEDRLQWTASLMIVDWNKTKGWIKVYRTWKLQKKRRKEKLNIHVKSGLAQTLQSSFCVCDL